MMDLYVTNFVRKKHDKDRERLTKPGGILQPFSFLSSTLLQWLKYISIYICMCRCANFDGRVCFPLALQQAGTILYRILDELIHVNVRTFTQFLSVSLTSQCIRMSFQSILPGKSFATI